MRPKTRNDQAALDQVRAQLAQIDASPDIPRRRPDVPRRRLTPTELRDRAAARMIRKASQ